MLMKAFVWVLGMRDLETALCVYENCRAQGVLLCIMAMKVLWDSGMNCALGTSLTPCTWPAHGDHVQIIPWEENLLCPLRLTPWMMLSVGNTQGTSSGDSHSRAAAAAGSCAAKPLSSIWHWRKMSFAFFHWKEWQISPCYWCNLSSMFSWMRVPMKNVYLQATGLEALDVLINFEGLWSE